MSGIRISRIGGKLFSSGLFWQPISGNPNKEKPSVLKSAGAELVQLASEMESDFIAWHPSLDAPQCGFYASSSSDIKPSKLISLALTLDHYLRSLFPEKANILCIVEIDYNEWYYFAKQDNLILADGEFIGSEDEVLSRAMQDLSVMSFDIIVAPEHWGIEESVEKDITDLIPFKKGVPKTPSRATLVPIKAKPLKVIIPVAAVVVALGAGLFGYAQYQNMLAAKAEQERLERMRAMMMEEPETPPMAPQPWPDMPFAFDLIDACMKNLHSTVITPGNWLLSEFNCNPDGASYIWRAQPGGWASHFRDIYPDAEFSPTLQSALVVKPHADLAESEETLEELTELPNPTHRTQEMRELAQHFNVSLSLTVSDPEALARANRERRGPAPTWHEIAWSTNNLQFDPIEYINIFDTTGYRATNLKGVIENGTFTWSIEGIQYAFNK